MQNQILKNALLYQLCRHFRLDYDDITYHEEIQMFYIYKHVSKQMETDEMEPILTEVQKISDTLKARSKRKKLYLIFRHCQSTSITESGRYDTTTLKPPPRGFLDDYY